MPWRRLRNPRFLLRALRRLAIRPQWRTALFTALALAAVWTPLGQAGALNDFRDSHLLHSYEEAAARTVTEYGQLPLWTPWSCGGLFAWGNPQTRQASPTLLLSALFGARRAEPMVLMLFLLLGMEGAFRYARLKAGNAVGALLVAPLFGLCGFGAQSWSLGWLYLLGFLLLPWVLWGTALAGRGRAKGAAAVALGFALMLGFGGTYPVPLAALFVAVEGGWALIAGAGPLRRRALALATTAALTLAACVFRLWPIWETLQSGPRVMAGNPGHSLQKVAGMLFSFPATGDKGGHGGLFFVGPGLVLLALPALLGRRSRFPVALTVLCGWLATGYAAHPAPFAWLRALPIFETLRYPERFLFPCALFLAVTGAIGVGVLQVWLRRPRSPALTRWAPELLGAVVLLCLFGWGALVAAYARLAGRAPLVALPTRVDQPFAQARGNRWAQGHLLALNRGSISCGEGFPVPMSPRLSGALSHEEWLEDGEGTVRRDQWTPNRLELEVHASRPARLVVNQNWHPGWRSSVGEVGSAGGLLSVQLPAGTHQVTLRFLPRSALGGLAVSLLTVLVLGALMRLPLGGTPALAMAAVPLIAWALIAILWKEPAQPPLLTNPDRSPLRVETLPQGVNPIEARFDPHLELVAAAIPSAPDARGEVPMELYWRVSGPVPRTVGIFVHLTGPGKRRSKDHAVIGGTWFFHDAPRGVLLRDAFAVNPHDWEAGEWEVNVGLWHASGDGSRLVPLLPSGAAAEESRLVVGRFVVPARP